MIEIVVALIGLSGVLFTAVVSVLTHKHAKETNKSVNCRPAGEPTLYQLTLGNAREIGKLDARVGLVEDGVVSLRRRFEEHDEWERGRKFEN